MATQGLGELGDLGLKRFVSHTLPQLMKGRQTAPQARLVDFPSHLERSGSVSELLFFMLDL